jgi:hypothetical protein
MMYYYFDDEWMITKSDLVTVKLFENSNVLNVVDKHTATWKLREIELLARKTNEAELAQSIIDNFLYAWRRRPIAYKAGL